MFLLGHTLLNLSVLSLLHGLAPRILCTCCTQKLRRETVAFGERPTLDQLLSFARNRACFGLHAVDSPLVLGPLWLRFAFVSPFSLLHSLHSLCLSLPCPVARAGFAGLLVSLLRSSSFSIQHTLVLVLLPLLQPCVSTSPARTDRRYRATSIRRKPLLLLDITLQQSTRS